MANCILGDFEEKVLFLIGTKHKFLVTFEALKMSQNVSHLQQKQSIVARQVITTKDSRQKPQGFTAKAIVSCSLH